MFRTINAGIESTWYDGVMPVISNWQRTPSKDSEAQADEWVHFEVPDAEAADDPVSLLHLGSGFLGPSWLYPNILYFMYQLVFNRLLVAGQLCSLCCPTVSNYFKIPDDPSYVNSLRYMNTLRCVKRGIYAHGPGARGLPKVDLCCPCCWLPPCICEPIFWALAKLGCCSSLCGRRRQSRRGSQSKQVQTRRSRAGSPLRPSRSELKTKVETIIEEDEAGRQGVAPDVIHSLPPCGCACTLPLVLCPPFRRLCGLLRCFCCCPGRKRMRGQTANVADDTGTFPAKVRRDPNSISQRLRQPIFESCTLHAVGVLGGSSPSAQQTFFDGVNLLLCMASTLPARWYWESQSLMALWGCVILSTTVWNGASFYVEVFANRYSGQLERKRTELETKRRQWEARRRKEQGLPPAEETDEGTIHSAGQGPAVKEEFDEFGNPIGD